MIDPQSSSTSAEMKAASEGHVPGFDEAWYLARYPDVAEAVARGDFGSGLDHYRHHGRQERRTPQNKEFVPPHPEFVSCQFLESSLLFCNDRLRACCIPLPNGKGNVTLCEYSGGPLPIDNIKASRNELRRLNNTPGADSPCEGCHYLKNAEWTNTHLVQSFVIGHYAICNLRCTYCDVSDYSHDELKRNAVAPYSVTEPIRELIGANLLAPQATACWAGGEPTMFKEFEETMSVFAQHGVPLTLMTNCTRDSDAVKKGLAARSVCILCSVDAGTSETYRRIKGRGKIEDVWRVLKGYAEIFPEGVVAKYIVKDENCSNEEIDRFVEDAATAGLCGIVISRDVKEYNGPMPRPETAPLRARLVAAMARMAFQARKRGLLVQFSMDVFSEAEKDRIRLELLRLALAAGEADFDFDIPVCQTGRF